MNNIIIYCMCYIIKTLGNNFREKYYITELHPPPICLLLIINKQGEVDSNIFES